MALTAYISILIPEKVLKKSTTTYAYYPNNWMYLKGGTYLSYDANGNLRWDGKSSYTYDAANRLSELYDTSSLTRYLYSYDGMDDLLSASSLYLPTGTTQTTQYVQDVAAGLSQVLSDGENTYLYGYSRLEQVNAETSGYFLGDALNSVRQVVDPEAEIKLMNSYAPYGDVIESEGSFDTPYGYNGELTDSSGLINLRARWRELCAPEPQASGVQTRAWGDSSAKTPEQGITRTRSH